MLLHFLSTVIYIICYVCIIPYISVDTHFIIRAFHIVTAGH